MDTDKVYESNQTDTNKNVQNYTMTYRVIKTILMISAWISFGINCLSYLYSL
jgi:hypothetical protein